MRATSRLCGCSINTVTKLARDVGWYAIQYMDTQFLGLPFINIQCDEITSIIRGRRKNLKEKTAHQPGEVYTWLAIEPASKLVFAWHIGGRTRKDANEFLTDVHKRLTYKPIIATDAYAAYNSQIAKVFGDAKKHNVMMKGDVKRIDGHPVHTSFVERMNGTIRMINARYRRRSQTYSKNIYDHNLHLATTFLYYNFCRRHATLKCTPAMVADIAERPLTLEEIVRHA